MIANPIRGILRPVVRRILPPYFVPIDLFSAGEQGAWFLPSDFSTLRQNSNGDVPVTAVGQSVGLVLDRSRALSVGPEIVVNGNFSAGSSNWTTQNGTTPITVSSGEAVIGAATFCQQKGLTFSAGKTYKISIDIRSAGTIQPFAWLATGDYLAGAQQVLSGATAIYPQQTITFYAKPTAAKSVLVFKEQTGAGGTMYLDNISAKEIYGNPALQATSASRPVLATQSNLLHLSGGSINWTAPAGSYTVAYLDDSGPTILTGQSLSGATNVMATSKIFEYVAVNRALTADEQQGLLDYFDLKGRYL